MKNNYVLFYLYNLETKQSGRLNYVESFSFRITRNIVKTMKII